jgi:NTE family protein
LPIEGIAAHSTSWVWHEKCGLVVPMTENQHTPTTASRTALVLSGGGARGAYQVGVLQALLDIGCLDAGASSAGLLVGSSAGAINVGMLAATADRFADGVARLAGIWTSLDAGHVFRTDMLSLGTIGLRWVRDLTFGGALGRVSAKALLDTAPLRDLLKKHFPLRHIPEHIARGTLRAATVSATDLYTGTGVQFVQGAPDLPLWTRAHWSVERAELGVEHLLASSAIPIFFPSVRIGSRHFGDGCIRNTTPLGPAIRLGADRIIAIGVRGVARPATDDGRRRPPPTIANIAGVLLDAVLLDAVEADVEHSGRVNASVLRCASGSDPECFREVDVLWLAPSQSIGAIAAELEDRIPAVVRYLLRGLGSDEATTELASYLLFDAEFARRLIELGRRDVQARREYITEFFKRTDQCAALRVRQVADRRGVR